MDTDSKLNISYEEYLKILEDNKDLFGRYWSKRTGLYR